MPANLPPPWRYRPPGPYALESRAWPATSTARWAGCARSCCTGPGAELKRLTPRNNDQLLFDGIPWVDRAQEEHDGFAQALRDHGVEVLYLGELLEQALDDPDARELDHRRRAGRTPGSARPSARWSAGTCTTCTRPTWPGCSWPG